MAALLLGGAMAPVFAADVRNLSVTVSSGTQANAYGGYTIEEGASALQNALTLSGPAKVLKASAGGWSRWGNAEWNTLTIRLDEDGLLGPSDIVSGGVAESEGGGAAVHNTVYIESGTVEGTVEGGVAVGINGVGDGTGDVLSNQVTMSGGTVYSVFGGETGEGNANDNVVTIKGSAAVTGKSNAVYGGYTIDGNASGNIVNIEDDADIYGEIMGGYTRAGSLISGNKVNVTGGNVNENTVYGAYTETSLGFASAGSADVTNNEVAISGGSGVAEVYGGRSYSGLAQGNKVTISAASVSGNVYGAYTAYGDVLDNQAVIKETGQAGSSDTNSVYAGFTNIGAAAGNILYIQDSAEIAGSAFAGYQGGFISSETVERNQVFMSGGSVGGDLTGGGSNNGGETLNNYVEITGGTVSGNVYSGFTDSADALENTLTVAGGRVEGSLFGGYSNTGTANENKLTFSAGTAGSDAYGGYAQEGADGNEAVLSGTSVLEGNAAGGSSARGEASGNSLAIKENSEVKGDAAGGDVYMGTISKNIITIQYNAKADGNVYGGIQQIDPALLESAEEAIEKINSNTNLSDEDKKARVAAIQTQLAQIQASMTGTAEGNEVTLNGGTVAGKTYGGSVMGTGNAEGNSVTLNAGSVNDDIYGGYAANGSALDNTVTIKGGTIAPAASLYGGYSTTESSGNSLNFYVKDVTVKNLKYFQTLNFYVPAGTTAGETMLEVTDAADVSGAAIRAAVEDTTQLNPGEVINLIHTTESPILTEKTTYGMMDGKDQVTDVNLLQRTVGIKKQDANTIVLYVPGDSPITTDPETKVIPDERESGTTLISEGSDLAVNEGFESALAAHEAGWIEDHSIKAEFIPYVVLGGHNLRYDTGSEVDSNGFNGEVGFVKRSYHEDYIDTIMPFFEYGDGNYTVHYEDARSDGDQRYIGGGILIRRDKDDGFHYEGIIRTGHFDGDLHGTVSGNHIRYDTDSNYIAAHLGLGKTYVRDTNEYDLYGKLYWARLGSDTILIKNDLGNTTYELDSVDSFRTRLGLRWTKNKNGSKSYYAGIAWDYEFAGKAKAWHGDYSTPSSSLKGSSAFLELGWQTKVTEEDPWGLDLRVRGWTGKKEGFTYSTTISRRF